jgi:hypothetical protein
VSGIYRVLIQAPQAPAPAPTPAASSQPTLAMRASDATFYVRRVIKDRTRRQSHNLRYGCARRTTRSFRCRPNWFDNRNLYAGTVTFTHFSEGGLRASRSCARRRSVKTCARSFRWNF